VTQLDSDPRRLDEQVLDDLRWDPGGVAGIYFKPFLRAAPPADLGRNDARPRACDQRHRRGFLAPELLR
jgi:hypothetical protein